MHAPTEITVSVGTPTVHDRVQGTIERMTSALAVGDVDRVMTTYEPDAVVLFEPASPASGDEKLRLKFAELLAAGARFENGDHEVVVAGDIALHLMPWSMEATGPDGSAIQQHGLSVAVLRRQADGEWRMIIDNPHGHRLYDQHGWDPRPA